MSGAAVMEDTRPRTSSHKVAKKAAKAWVRLHKSHVGKPTNPADKIRIVMLKEQLVETFDHLISHHDFDHGDLKVGGDFHPDARLMTAATKVGIANSLDAFPPHTVMTIAQDGITIGTLQPAT